MRTAGAMILLLVASAFGQDGAAKAAAQAACGPNEIKFDAKEDVTHHPVPQPDPGKAMVYVVQEIGELQCKGCALTRVGLDGT